MKRFMKRLAVVLTATLLFSDSSATIASVFLNSTDYGSNLQGALSAARTGDIVEFNDSGSYSLAGQNHMAYAGVTVRSAADCRATILATDGGTNSTFMLEAANITFQNLNITGQTYQPGLGTYAFGLFGTKDAENNYPAIGLTIAEVNFLNLRGVIDAGSGWVKDLAFVDNTVTNTNYGLGKSGMNFGGGVVITGNTFTNNGVGTGAGPQPALWIEHNRGSLLIDDNTFGDYDGSYAIYSNVDLSSHPITLGTNDFGAGVGGSGAAYELYPLQNGGHAVGLLNAASAVPEPGALALLITAGLGTLGYVWRRR